MIKRDFMSLFIHFCFVEKPSDYSCYIVFAFAKKYFQFYLDLME